MNVILLVVATIIPVVVFVSGWRHASRLNQNAAGRLANAITTGHEADTDFGIHASAPLVSTALQPSPIYPFSVIPGGARSREELKSAVLHDPVAAAHYAGFDVARTRVIRLSHAEKVYVSYRIGDRIYWTSKRLYIPAGETLLTDGEHEARTRCGNRLSETPQAPISTKEPSRAVLNGPATAMPALAVTEPLLASALVRPEMDLGEIVGPNPADGRSFNPPDIPIPGGPLIGGPGLPPLSPSKNPPANNPQPPVAPPPPPIAPTPEPSSGLLFFLSGGLLSVVALRRRIHS
ncbi:MAG TPA: PEP-CTERM sorting domain-containing protein [Candidatus Acidoferrum sp.]|nr:PEP-CTERM sorting domain-containing protein [Candidatus Acidoferrum sp.]